MKRRVAILALFALVSGCEAPLPAAAPPPPPSTAIVFASAGGEAPPGGFTVVRTFYGTDRNLTSDPKAAKRFGSDYSKADMPISYGTADVSIPRQHKTGNLESPSIWRLEFSEDPTKHVVLLDVSVLSQNAYFAALAARVRASQGASAFVFVHGFNVTFEAAARRTAQMYYDLQFDGVPVFYSWPSRGGSLPLDYTADEDTVLVSKSHLQSFLTDFLQRSGAKEVFLIAHSMGNRPLTEAVKSLLTEQPQLGQRIKEIILTAPDVSTAVFKQDIAPVLIKAGRPITLYASSDDVALKLSVQIHNDKPRLGSAGKDLVVMPGIETVDATGVDTSFLSHSYFGEVRSVISDIASLIDKGLRASQRGLKRMGTAAEGYWTIP